MSIYYVTPTVTNYQDTHLIITLDPKERDRAWNYIIALAKKMLTLERIDDTSFKVVPQKGYDLQFCFSVVVAALIASEDLNLSFTWSYRSIRQDLKVKTATYKFANTSHLHLSGETLNFLLNQLIKQYAIETIDDLIKQYQGQILDKEPIINFIEELRQGYSKLKFHPHDFWYRHFGGLQHDLGEIDRCLADAELLLDAINIFNSSIEAEAEAYQENLGKKWKARDILESEVFEVDTRNLKTETFRKQLAKESAKFAERLTQIRNRAIRLFPV